MLMHLLGFGICRFDGLVLYTWIRWCFDLEWLFLQSFVWLLVLGGLIDLGFLKFRFIASFAREEAAGFVDPLSFAGLSEYLWWMGRMAIAAPGFGIIRFDGSLLGLALFGLMDQCSTLGFDGILIMGGCDAEFCVELGVRWAAFPRVLCAASLEFCFGCHILLLQENALVRVLCLAAIFFCYRLLQSSWSGICVNMQEG
ncbi:hypothetical protein U1Q18_035009 [Sarracenia purpurea var. burkii]